MNLVVHRATAYSDMAPPTPAVLGRATPIASLAALGRGSAGTRVVRPNTVTPA